MKVLFLDHFGVMCLADKHGKESSKKDLPNIKEMRIHGDFDKFDQDAVKVLNLILEKDNEIEIVISSDWKRWCNLERMREFYKNSGIIKKPLDFTNFFEKIPYINNNSEQIKSLQHQRSIEIIDWLNNHLYVEKWVAVDDMYLSELQNFVWITKTDEGVTQKGIKDKILKYF